MIVVLFLIAGALLGFAKARARGGNRLDLAQYAAVHALLLGVVGTFVTVALMRLG